MLFSDPTAQNSRLIIVHSYKNNKWQGFMFSSRSNQFFAKASLHGKKNEILNCEGIFNFTMPSKKQNWKKCDQELQIKGFKNIFFVRASAIFPRIVSAETIIFWIWKLKGHSK